MMKNLQKKELESVNGGGIVSFIAGLFGRTKLSLPGMKSKWVRKGTEDYTRKWEKK